MENLFDTNLDIHEQYDLKGSTVNRFVGEKMELFNPSVALKDLDFHRRLRLGPVMKALMLEQAEIDCMVRYSQLQRPIFVEFNLNIDSSGWRV